MLSYTKKKEAQVKRQIYAGEVQANPYELNGSTGCDYCAYRDICGFDPSWTVMRTGAWKSTRKKKSSAGWKKKSKTGRNRHECTVDRRSEKGH